MDAWLPQFGFFRFKNIGINYLRQPFLNVNHFY